MTSAVLEVRSLTPADWKVLREIRLQSLLDSPHAFTSAFGVELGWNEHQWQRRLETATWVMAAERRQPVGIVGLTAGEDGLHYMESIWVAPTHRRQGVFRSMLRKCMEIGQERGLDRLQLWVLDTNATVAGAYTRLGFVLSGKPQEFEPGRFEQCYELII
jgi:ribosomal protein S18 acetylase RimI-like enzyme